MKYNRTLSSAVLCFSLFALSACTDTPGPLPQGTQTLKGTLARAEISLRRRGTHLLLQDGQPLYYVESSKVSLHPYEGKEIVLQGVLEYNTEAKALPVLVVDKVIGGDEKPKVWNVPSLGISFSVPDTWKGNVQASSVQFTLSGSLTSVALISMVDASVLPFNFQSLTASSSTLTLRPLVIGTYKAVSIVREERNNHTVYIDVGAKDKRFLAFSFALMRTRPLQVQVDEQLRIVQSLSVSSSSARSSVRTSVSGSANGSASNAQGKPCGGPAGILCPAGYFCQVTDAVTDIGVCKKI